MPAGTACGRQAQNIIAAVRRRVPCAEHVSPCIAGVACSWRLTASPARMWTSAQPRRTSARGSASTRTPASQVGCLAGTDLPSLLPHPRHADRSCTPVCGPCAVQQAAPGGLGTGLLIQVNISSLKVCLHFVPLGILVCWYNLAFAFSLQDVLSGSGLVSS